MIKRYSTYFALVASTIVLLSGILARLSFQNLVIRVVLTFFFFIILGNLLGVITIEALLEGQERKVSNKTKEEN